MTNIVDGMRWVEPFIFQQPSTAHDTSGDIVLVCGFKPGFAEFISLNANDKQVAYWTPDLGQTVMLSTQAATGTYAASGNVITQLDNGLQIQAHVDPFSGTASGKWLAILHRVTVPSAVTVNNDLPVYRPAASTNTQNAAQFVPDGTGLDPKLNDALMKNGIYRIGSLD